MNPGTGGAVATAGLELATPPIKPSSLFRRSLRLWRTRIGLGLILLLILIAIFGPSIGD